MTNANSVKRRYLALWFPFLPTDRLRCQQSGGFIDQASGPPEAPLVLITRIRGAVRLGAVDARAQALGLAPGQTLADARAAQPDLRVADMDEEADRHWLARLARRCACWSPLVTIVAPDGVTLDIAGVAHLFGGEAGLAAQVDDAMGAAGMAMRLAIAGTAEAAQALARHAPLPVGDELAAIKALPVAALGLDAEAALALRRAGLRSVGDVAARPAIGIAARFGGAAVTALRRLMGEEQAPIAPLAALEPLRFVRQFPEPVAHQRMVAACFADLLEDAAEALARRGLGGRRFCLALARSDGARHELVIETGEPTRDAALVLRLFDERIASLADPLDPGFGYDSIALHIARAEPLIASQPALDGGRQGEGMALVELIDRLGMRLGADSLCRLVPQDSHIPERAQLALPATQCRTPPRWSAPSPGEPPLRPLVLFEPPQPVEVIAEVPDGPPHRFRWRRTLHEVRLYEGPERIAPEWWRRKGGERPGDAGLTRDYYRIEDVRGRRYWIFRHGLYDERPDPRWYLHGLFA